MHGQQEVGRGEAVEGRGRPWGCPTLKLLVSAVGRGEAVEGRGRPCASTPVFFLKFLCRTCFSVIFLFFLCRTCFSVFLVFFFVPDLLFHEFCTLQPPGQKFRLQRQWPCLHVLVLAPVDWGGQTLLLACSALFTIPRWERRGTRT